MHNDAMQTLKDALDVLRADAAASYHRVLLELEGLALDVQVGDERFDCRCMDARLRFDAVRRDMRKPQPDITVRTDRHTILALIDGRLTMMNAVLARQLAVQGDALTLARLSRAVVAFSEGALRSRGMRALLQRYRA
ncbi:SCP-2 sterol transfer family protein [Paraburkholderia caballeronis]|nr:SCP-2 sterol transfer family protein [Paraburkholderia caballeronis]